MAKNNKTLYRLVIVLAVLIYFVTAWNSHGFYHADEHFQIVEFADAKLGKSPVSELPWEYAAGLRPTIQPTIALSVFKIADWVGFSDPYGQVTLLRFLTVILAFISILYFIKTVFQNGIIRNQILFVFCSLLLFCLPFLNVRFSSETWAGLLFLYPIAQMLRKDSESINPFLIGVFLGLSFLFRYQVGFMIFGFILWMVSIKKTELAILFKIGLSFLGIFLIGVLIDSWFYNEFTISAWNYFKVNLLDDVASTFGVEPWHYYLVETTKVFGTLLGIFLIAILGSFFLLFRKHLLTWVLIPFLLIHFFIPHKEYRFLFPIVNLIPLLVFLLVEKYISWYKIKNFHGIKPVLYGILSLAVGINLLFAFALSNESVGIGRTEMSFFIHSTYSNQSVNLVNTKWASSYKPWGALINHYSDTNVNNIEIENPALLNNELYQDGKLNFLILRDIDLQNNPDGKAALINHQAHIIKESFNPLTKTLGQIFGVFELQENLILYTFEKQDSTKIR